MINVTLLKQTLVHIEANPDEWDQRVYRCGTGMCFAGWAAQLAGGRWCTADPTDGNGDMLIAEPEDNPNYVYQLRVGSDAKGTFASHRAKRVLGLTGDQAGELFYSDNTIDDLRRIVADLCGEAS